MEYIAVHSDVVSALIEKVNALLSLGWVVAGGICYGGGQWWQAMVRELK